MEQDSESSSWYVGLVGWLFGWLVNFFLSVCYKREDIKTCSVGVTSGSINICTAKII
jgi:hypothetical protein